MIWLKGLAAAAIGGAVSGIMVILVDPTSFNFAAGWRRLVNVAGVLALTHVAMYLKESPVPKDDDRLWR